MYKVLYNKKLNSSYYEMCIEAPLVVEKALPQTRNKNYTKYGTITQPQAASVLVDVRG